MIARHWRGWTKLGDADGYERLLRETMLPQLKQIVGYQGGYVLRHDGDENQNLLSSIYLIRSMRFGHLPETITQLLSLSRGPCSSCRGLKYRRCTMKFAPTQRRGNQSWADRPQFSEIILVLEFRWMKPFAVDYQKQTGALLIAACIVAAIRLRGEPIARSPKVHGYDFGFRPVGKDGAEQVAEVKDLCCGFQNCWLSYPHRIKRPYFIVVSGAVVAVVLALSCPVQYHLGGYEWQRRP
jgi:hypothetical protein